MSSFYDWIRSKGWRDPHRRRRGTLSPRSSQKRIRAVIELLLDDQMACEAQAALEAVGEHAAPMLEDALREPKFRDSIHWPQRCAATTFEMIILMLQACVSPTPRPIEQLADQCIERNAARPAYARQRRSTASSIERVTLAMHGLRVVNHRTRSPHSSACSSAASPPSSGPRRRERG
jgi:hypothetical protein